MTELARTLDATLGFLRSYVVFPLPEQADAVALWVGHTYVYDQFDCTPYLAVQSPEKRSGKTRLMECVAQLARQPQPTAGASLAALFRIIHDAHPTLLIDEADTIFNKKTSDASEDIRGLLNNGYRRGVPYLRVVGDGKKMHVERFDVFAPKMIASIRALPDTVQDRSIIVHLKRRARGEAVGRFRLRRAEQEAAPIRESWEALAETLILPDEVDVPDELDDRAADSWEPLVALGEAAGDEWVSRARHAAAVLSGAGEVEDDTLPIRLLAGIRSVFDDKGVDRLPTSVLLDGLHADEEAPWADWHGRGLKAEGLAYLLRPFAIRARQMKLDGAKVRGFDRDVFTDAWDRYLRSPGTPLSTRYLGTSKGNGKEESTEVPGETQVPGEGQEPSLWVEDVGDRYNRIVAGADR
jgi:hypothetical protein